MMMGREDGIDMGRAAIPRVRRRILDGMDAGEPTDGGMAAPPPAPAAPTMAAPTMDEPAPMASPKLQVPTMDGMMPADDGMNGGQAQTAPSPPMAAPSAPPPPAAPSAAPSAYKRTAANKPPGVTSEKWLGGHVSPEYAYKEVAMNHNLKTDQGRQAMLADLKSRYPQYFANASLQRDKLHIGGELHPQFQGHKVFDVIRDEEGGATMRWGTPEQDAINQQIAATQQAGGGGPAPKQRGIDPMLGSQRGMDTTQTSMIDQIRDTILKLMTQQGAA